MSENGESGSDEHGGGVHDGGSHANEAASDHGSHGESTESDHEHHGKESDHDHDHHHHDVADLGVAVLTVSSTRSIDDDAAGDAVVDIVESAGHEVTVRELVRDEYDSVQGAVDRFVDRGDTDCVVTTGGTGVTPDDVTTEAVQPLFDKRLPGFGELFRRLSYEDIGTKVVGTRAVAGVADGAPVFCLPGSESAARLGVSDIVVEEAPHLAGLARRGEDAEDEKEE